MVPNHWEEELLPDDVEYSWQHKLIVNSDGHVARLVEGRRHSPHGVTQIDRPQQEEELGWEAKKQKRSIKHSESSGQEIISMRHTLLTWAPTNQPLHTPAHTWSCHRWL